MFRVGGVILILAGFVWWLVGFTIWLNEDMIFARDTYAATSFYTPVVPSNVDELGRNEAVLALKDEQQHSQKLEQAIARKREADEIYLWNVVLGITGIVVGGAFRWLGKRGSEKRERE